jgi:hypothetical protein
MKLESTGVFDADRNETLNELRRSDKRAPTATAPRALQSSGFARAAQTFR